MSSFYDHPFVKALTRKTSTRDGKPSYIPNRTFASVVTAILPSLGDQNEGRSLEQMVRDIPDEDLRKSLLTLLREAGGNFENLKDGIERWFDDAMDRVSGWYKRRTQLVTFVVAIGIAATLNADTVRIATTLWTNPTLRSTLVAQAEQAVNEGQAGSSEQQTASPQATATPTATATPQPTPSPTKPATPTVQESIDQVKALPLPLGWTSANKRDPRALPDSVWEWVIKALGLMLTACAPP